MEVQPPLLHTLTVQYPLPSPAPSRPSLRVEAPGDGRPAAGRRLQRLQAVPELSATALRGRRGGRARGDAEQHVAGHRLLPQLQPAAHGLAAARGRRAAGAGRRRGQRGSRPGGDGAGGGGSSSCRSVVREGEEDTGGC